MGGVKSTAEVMARVESRREPERRVRWENTAACGSGIKVDEASQPLVVSLSVSRSVGGWKLLLSLLLFVYLESHQTNYPTDHITLLFYLSAISFSSSQTDKARLPTHSYF